MVKRGVWVAACVIGVVVCGGLAVLSAYALFIAAETGAGQMSLRAAGWPVVLILAAGACAAGLFTSPREFTEAMKPAEPDVQRPSWLDDLSKPAEPPRADDKRE